MKAVFKIKGMHCVSCSMNIDGTLEELSGVMSANTSYAKSETKVEFDKQKTNEQKIKQAILALGYKVL